MKLARLISYFAAVPQAALSTQPSGQINAAVYFLRVDPQGSSVVGIGANAQGLLVHSSTMVTSTKGKGLQAQNYSSPTLAPVTTEALLSQGAVAVGDNYLFTVNSGSNTAVMFAINPQNPIELTMIGEPVSTLGQFPVSIAPSSKLQLACVLNGGAVNGVTCYNVSPTKGLIPDGHGLREFGFAATTPPQLFGPQGSGADVTFDPTSEKLVVTFRGPATGIGHVVIFNTNATYGVARTFVDNQLPAIMKPLGISGNPLHTNQFFVADIAIGGGHSLYRNANNTISILATVNDKEINTSCWSTFANTQYVVVNAESPNVGLVDGVNGKVGLQQIINYNTTLVGGFDSIVGGANNTSFGYELLYFLNHLNTVGVLDIKSGRLVQLFEFSTLEDRPYWTGMAHYPARAYVSGGQNNAAEL